jgi:hypothetical protein
MLVRRYDTIVYNIPCGIPHTRIGDCQAHACHMFIHCFFWNLFACRILVEIMFSSAAAAAGTAVQHHHQYQTIQANYYHRSYVPFDFGVGWVAGGNVMIGYGVVMTGVGAVVGAGAGAGVGATIVGAGVGGGTGAGVGGGTGAGVGAGTGAPVGTTHG